MNSSYGGTQDNGTLIYSGSLTWQGVQCGDDAWTAIDFKQPGGIYTDCQIAIFKFNGSTWSPVVNDINPADRVSFIAPLVMDPSNAQRLYFGTYRLYQTNDGAGRWTAISRDLTTVFQ